MGKSKRTRADRQGGRSPGSAKAKARNKIKPLDADQTGCEPDCIRKERAKAAKRKSPSDQAKKPAKRLSLIESYERRSGKKIPASTLKRIDAKSRQQTTKAPAEPHKRLKSLRRSRAKSQQSRQAS